jgi:hypothetical protein
MTPRRTDCSASNLHIRALKPLATAALAGVGPHPSSALASRTSRMAGREGNRIRGAMHQPLNEPEILLPRSSVFVVPQTFQKNAVNLGDVTCRRTEFRVGQSAEMAVILLKPVALSRCFSPAFTVLRDSMRMHRITSHSAFRQRSWSCLTWK